MLELSALTQWLSAHDQLILPAVGFIAFIESLAIMGIIVPGVALLFAVAALASLSEIPLEAVLFAAFLGAVAGDVLSFFIGRAFHKHLHSKWPFSRYPDALKQGEVFFEKYGGLSVVIGRFIGPLRPVLPITAGMLHMPPVKFVVINILSALAWAPAYILPGYLSAELSQTALGNHDAEMYLFAIGAAAICLITWMGIVRACDQNTKSHTTLRISFGLAFVGLIATSILMIEGYFDRTDVWLLSLATLTQDFTARSIFTAVTLAGDQLLLVMLFTITTLMVAAQKHWRVAFIIAVTGLSTSLITHALKNWFDVLRPDLVLGSISSQAFPSGHTSGFSVLVGLMVCLAFTQTKLHQTQKSIVKLSALTLISLVAASRVILGVHWLSDVIAGLLLGAVITSTALWALVGPRQYSNNSEPSVPALSMKPIVITLALVTALYISLFFDNAIQFYSIR